ncbi:MULTISPECIES: hypothetical protein [unclassified Campylobacter]|uniref:hypothetical protein n=1 Tax=unclassified Campylobacter TaxID=2593542 RepID=UPI001CC20C8F|nr:MULTISPECIES: hypothetical protein [unclassified Campylobacter]
MISFYDELFYAYLVWSLKDFILTLSQGMLQNEINLLFNLAIYVDEKKIKYRFLDEELKKLYEKELKSINLYERDYYDHNFFIEVF